MGGLTFYWRNRDRNLFWVAIFTISLNPIFFLLPLCTPCWNKHCSSYIFFCLFCNANAKIIPNQELSLGLLFPIFSTIGKQRKGLFYSNYLTHQNKLRQPITIHTSSVCTQPNDVPLMNINPPAYHHHLYFGNPPWGEVDENMVAFPFCAYYYIHIYHNFWTPCGYPQDHIHTAERLQHRNTIMRNSSPLAKHCPELEY